MALNRKELKFFQDVLQLKVYHLLFSQIKKIEQSDWVQNNTVIYCETQEFEAFLFSRWETWDNLDSEQALLTQ